jgi:hypothetical protein
MLLIDIVLDEGEGAVALWRLGGSWHRVPEKLAIENPVVTRITLSGSLSLEPDESKDH